MSFNVLVVPEDPINNGYILKPLVSRMLSECGRPSAKVQVLTNPRATGYAHAKDVLLNRVLDAYGHFDLVLFLPDSDGRDLTDEFARLEQRAREREVPLLCCAAVQEVEAWLLAGHVDALGLPWGQVRADTSVKENVFMPFLKKHGDQRRAGAGRDQLMEQTLRNYRGLLGRCEELSHLQERIKAVLAD